MRNDIANPVIVVVAYRRLNTLQRLLSSISKAIYKTKSITLIISIDYHPDNSDIIQHANDFEWKFGCKIVCTHKENLGLRNHIIECGNYSKKYGSIILLEDDEIVAPMFYEYARTALSYYYNDTNIAGVSLYGREWNDYECNRFQPIMGNGDVYFGQFSCTWGQAWTDWQWSEFLHWYEMNPTITCDELLPPSIYKWKESWGKYFIRYLAESNRYYVIPYKPLSTVYGEQGIHVSIVEYHTQNSLYWGDEEYHFMDFEQGNHYDSFFENVDLKKYLSKKMDLNETDLCIDLYGLKKRDYTGKRYVLSTKKINRKILAQYDLNMRPHEVNVLLNISGNKIFLYDMNSVRKNRSSKFINRLQYDFAGNRGLEALTYGITHIIEVLFGMLRRKK